MQPQKEVSIILIVRVFDNFLIIPIIEKRSEGVTKTKFVKLWLCIGWHIQKKQDEKFSLAKNQPVRQLVQNGSKI